jgi:protein-L-isoaspartate(D-aspartate) O-methyltransferase
VYMRLFAAVVLAFLVPPLSAGEDPFAIARRRMVAEQIECRGIGNGEVLRVMRSTPRHLFMPVELQPMAYEDHPVPIGYGATISQPYIVALMTELLAPAKHHRLLEIGTGSGYQAAILAQLAAEVYTIEIVPELARSAAETLKALGYANVHVRHGDGYAGWPERAPFDAIIVTAAPVEIPQALLKQLANGGRMIAPLGPRGAQELVLIHKDRDGTIRKRRVAAVSFVPMIPANR